MREQKRKGRGGAAIRTPRAGGDRAPSAAGAILRVLLVDDHAVVRMGIGALLRSEPDMTVVGEAASCAEACERARQLQPDVVVFDLSMDDCSGAKGVACLLDACPELAVVVYSALDSDHLVQETIALGARGFVPKGVSPLRLVDALRAVSHGHCYLDPSVTSAVLKAPCSTHQSGSSPNGMPITTREKAVLELLALGMRNKDISRALDISERTVKFHVSALMRKLGAGNRTEAVKKAIDSGVVGTR